MEFLSYFRCNSITWPDTTHSREQSQAHIVQGSQSAALKLIISNYRSSSSSDDSNLEEDNLVDKTPEIVFQKGTIII